MLKLVCLSIPTVFLKNEDTLCLLPQRRHKTPRTFKLKHTVWYLALQVDNYDKFELNTGILTSRAAMDLLFNLNPLHTDK